MWMVVRGMETVATACKTEFGYPPTTPPNCTGGVTLATPFGRFRLHERHLLFHKVVRDTPEAMHVSQLRVATE